jgi:hypothetical protein
MLYAFLVSHPCVRVHPAWPTAHTGQWHLSPWWPIRWHHGPSVGRWACPHPRQTEGQSCRIRAAPAVGRQPVPRTYASSSDPHTWNSRTYISGTPPLKTGQGLGASDLYGVSNTELLCCRSGQAHYWHPPTTDSVTTGSSIFPCQPSTHWAPSQPLHVLAALGAQKLTAKD